MTSPLARFEAQLAESARAALGLDAEDLPLLTKQVREAEGDRGDLALGCFAVAKKLKEAPPQIASRVAAAIVDDEHWASVEAVGPYVNVTYAPALFAEAVVPVAREQTYGAGDEGADKNVVIDFSSPNIAKPLAYHHLRSTVIGAAIGRLHAARGWNVVGINYLGDWGKQFGLLATGFDRNGDPARRADAKHLVDVYVKSNAEADVGKRKAAIAAPDEARKMAAALDEARTAAADDSDAKAQKKAAKSVKALEKKLRAKLNLDADAPLDDLSAQYAALEDAAKKAEAELPQVEALDREARMFLKAMEDGEDAALAAWREFREISIEEFKRVYDRMGIEFTSIEGESRYGDALQGALERVRDKPGTEMSDGAEIVKMKVDKGEPPAILVTRDGTALYLTRDIAAAMDRHERFTFERSLYVVAADQSLHFKQLFKTLGAMGFDWADKCEHVPFGRVHGMATRKGNVVFLDEVLDKAVAKAREACEQSEKLDAEHFDATVEAIGTGVIMFGDLKNLRTSDYEFSWDEVLSFSGHTGPYVQFSHARACSILKKGGGVPAEADVSRLVLPEEQALIVALAKYPAAVLAACDAYEPSYVTRAILEVAQKTASYLTAGNRDRSMRVLNDDAALQAARLHLIDGVRHVLSHGLGLLGVRAPDAM
ncbi:MAG: arginine--tRNA ligase [Deltaproteobacteria bacterium]